MSDFLYEIDDQDLPKLRDLYKNGPDDTIHVYNYLSTVIKWKAVKEHAKYCKILVTLNVWTTGTFIGLNQFYFNQLFTSTLEESGDNLYRAIVETKLINWRDPWKFYALSERIYPIVMSALKKTPYEVHEIINNNIWWLPKEEALKLVIKCPTDVYISTLKPVDSKVVDEFWATGYQDIQRYYATLIEINGGTGVYLKNNDKLVAWSLQDIIGLGSLGTVRDYRNKGYGKIATTYLAKKMAEAGYNPAVSVVRNNTASEVMFTRNGFRIACPGHSITNKQMHLRRAKL